MEEKRMNNEKVESTPKRAILCAIHPQNGEKECLVSLNELERLLETAGGVSLAYLTQMRDAPDCKTVFGSGKV